MDKKGMSAGMQIILFVIFAIIVFIAVTGLFGLSFVKIKGYWADTVGSISGQIDELKKALGLGEIDKPGLSEAERKALEEKAVQKAEEIYTGAAKLDKILLDAANFITGKNRDVTVVYGESGGEGLGARRFESVLKGSNDKGIISYFGAIEKYIEYYGECKVPKSICGLNGDLIKLRILNVVKEMVFNGKSTHYPSYDFKGAITQKEFDSAVNFIQSISKVDQKNCNEFKTNFIRDRIILTPFETKNRDGWSLLLIKDFSFIVEANKKINEFCGSVSVETSSENLLGDINKNGYVLVFTDGKRCEVSIISAVIEGVELSFKEDFCEKIIGEPEKKLSDFDVVSVEVPA